MNQRYAWFWVFRKGSGNSLSITFCVWFFTKNISYVIYSINWQSDRLYILTYGHSQPPNIGPQDIPGTSPSNIPRTSPKDPIWPSRERPNLTSWGRLEMTSRGRLNLTFKGRPWEVDSGRPLEDLQSPQPWMSKLFFQNLFDWPNLKAFQHSRCIENSVKLLRWSIFCKIS